MGTEELLTLPYPADSSVLQAELSPMQGISTDNAQSPRRSRRGLGALPGRSVAKCRGHEPSGPHPHPDQLHIHISQKHIILRFSQEEKALLSTGKDHFPTVR